MSTEFFDHAVHDDTVSYYNRYYRPEDVVAQALRDMKPVYDLYQQIIDAGIVSGQKFTADPRPLDKNVPSNFAEDLIFKKLMPYRVLAAVSASPLSAASAAVTRQQEKTSTSRSEISFFMTMPP